MWNGYLSSDLGGLRRYGKAGTGDFLTRSPLRTGLVSIKKRTSFLFFRKIHGAGQPFIG